jgi:signal transduction histidine kinase
LREEKAVFLNRISTKLAIVGLSFILPIATMLSLMSAAKQKDIDFATQETLGNSYQLPLERLMEDLSRHRVAVVRIQSGDAESADQLPGIRQGLETHLQDLITINAKIGAELQFTADGLGKRNREAFTAERLSLGLKALMDKDPRTLAAQDYASLFQHIRTMITHAGDTSNLILDPDLDSYYLMDVSLLALPQLQDRMQEIAVFVEEIHARAAITDKERIQASVYAAFLREADRDRIVLSSQTALNEDPNFYGTNSSMQKTLPLGLQLFSQSLTPVIEHLQDLAQVQRPQDFDITRFRSTVDLALSNIYSYHFLCFDELGRLLQVRIADIEANKKQAIIWTMLSLALSLLLFVWIATSMIRRVSRISQATRMIADGNLQTRVGAQGGDELGQLARSFDQMTDNVARLNSEIARKNADLQDVNQNLEKIVAERTVTINTILDNVKFGFLLLGRDLLLREGFSKSCQDLLGDRLRAGMPFRELFHLQDHRSVALYEAFIEQAFEDFLPEEMTLRQIPSRLRISDRMLHVQVTTVRTGNEVSSLLFTITDATSLEKVERENTRHKTLVRLLREIEAFRNFLDETKARLNLTRKLIRAGEHSKVRAEMHTIKGNAAAFDLMDIASLIHNIEDLPDIGLDSIDLIEKEFELFLQENYEILQINFSGDSTDNTLVIEQKHLDEIVLRIGESSSSEEMRSQVNDWVADMRYKQARVLIGALPEYGERLASRLEKTVDIKIEGAETRMDPDVMRPVMHSLIHLVRNAIDHGLESPDERESIQKSPRGSIVITCRAEADSWLITFADDGRGINLSKVIQKALKNGHIAENSLQTMSREQKLSLIFLSGMSTSENVTDISGRGVGMHAVQQAVENAGGKLTVSSEEGRGTVIALRIPKARGAALRKAG